MSRSLSAPDLLRRSHRMIVIPPERRHKRRYVTLKNAVLAGAALVVVFFLLSLWSAFRPRSSASATLSQSPIEISNSTAVHHEPTIVSEGSTYDQPEADSRLLDSAAQDQLQAAAAPAAAPAPSPAVDQFEPRTSQLDKGQRITISGGSEGVRIHAEPMPVAASTSTP